MIAWEPRGMIQVASQPSPPVPRPPGQPVDVHQLIACPTCRARVDQTCRSASGHPREPHVTRLAPRLCPCGQTLEPRKHYCEPCRVQRRRDTYQLREQRTPTRQRRSKEAA